MYDVAVIGAGIIGAMTARELTKYDVSVCILERENDVAMGATKANSAIVHAGFDAKPKTLKARLNVKGSEMMAEVAKELGVKYKNNGSLVIGFNDDDKKTLERLLEQGEQNGVKGLKIVNREELVMLEENIGDSAVCALYAPTGAIVCPYELCIAAAGNAMDNGAALKLSFDVKKIEKTAAGYKISSDSDFVEARYVINAAGVHSDDIAKMAGDTSFTVHPRRGEYILMDKECGNLAEHTIFRTPTKMGKGILVSPTVDGNLLLGPTSVDMEMNEKSDTKTHSDGFNKIMKEAAENIQNIPFDKAITSFCGLRSVGSTGDFIITSPQKGFINAAGIESPGLSSSPAIAEYIVNMLKDTGLELKENENFNPFRKPSHAFREADIDTKNRIIKKDSRYGKIVCRCETVTEGEIVEAIHQNPGARDIDGVKRRTRSGLGRCQGGFCLPYVAEILSKELGIPYEAVTKSGKASEIVIGKTKHSSYDFENNTDNKGEKNSND